MSATTKEVSGPEQQADGIWEFSQSREAFMDEVVYSDGKIVKTLGRLDAATRKIYFIET